MILLGILFESVPFWGEVIAIGAVVLVFYSLMRRPTTGDETETFQFEDDLHAIRRHLERLEEEERPTVSKPKDPYAGLDEKELRRLADEAERKMRRMR